MLDLVLTNNTSSVSNLNVCDNLPGTDHDAVQFTFSILPPKQCTVYRYLYNYKKADFNTFRDTLSSVPWEIAESSDIDSWWENWKDLFLAAVSTDIPVVRWRRSKMKCWLSLAVIKAIKQKRIVYRKLKRKPSDCLAHKYKSLRNLVRKLTRKDYQIYAEKLSSSLGSDQKVFWNWVNKVKCCLFPLFKLMTHCYYLIVIRLSISTPISVPCLLMKTLLHWTSFTRS